MEQFSRTEMLIGKGKVDVLKSKTVLIFGIGGVGSYVAESLARCGIDTLILVDSDVVSLSNINRQIIALHSTVGKAKVEVMKERILDINPNANVICYQEFVSPENVDKFLTNEVDYVIDAIDTVKSKIAIIEKAKALDIPIISSMGTGNKLDPLKFKITDISKTSVCPLAKVIRKELKEKGIKKVKVLYSEEIPTKVSNDASEGKVVPASIAFVPSVAGLAISGEVVRDLIK
ncbi:MAG: tRNA threonylcarbamoyladenosine dehydratase [Clostridia bacterium]|nr:tRNA threonylcarbamoyladenosine dehydratase [Clostridia bacterium]